MDREVVTLLQTPYFAVVQEAGYFKINERAIENGVIIVAERGDGRFLLAHLQRRAIGGPSQEFPRGAIDAGETAVEAAIRELLEETGYVSRAASRLGRVHSNTSLLSSHVAVVHIQVGSPATDATDGEVDTVEWLTLDELDERMLEGQITDGHTLSALTLLGAARRKGVLGE
ncbi:NUDIX hydrolase [Geopseudomonas aromaticivorans]